MSDYNPGDNISTDNIDSEPQTTSDSNSDGSDSVDTPAASLEVTPHPHEVDVSVRSPATSDSDGLYKLFLHSDRVSGSVFLTRGDCLSLTRELQDATSAPDGSNADAVRERDEHLGAVEIGVSDQVTGFHYDDERDSVVVTSSDGDTIRVSPEEARARGDRRPPGVRRLPPRPRPARVKKDNGTLVEATDYDRVCTVLEMIEADEISKNKASDRLDTSRRTINRALNERRELYGLSM